MEIFGSTAQCVYCNSEKTRIAQLRKNKKIEKPIYFCKNCCKKFTPNDGFKRFRHPAIIIKTAVSLMRNGYSLGQVVYNLNRTFKVRVSRKTIFDWKKKFYS
ncbi:MAG: hypothetical protein WC548_03725 [Candidatus Pacearchaeota archaeon]